MTTRGDDGAAARETKTEGPGPVLLRRAFWFLRHGETDWNARNLSQGNIEVPLNATGIRQAELAATRIADVQVAHIVSSPLERARITAGIVATRIGLPVTVDPDLHEASYGVREGQPMEDWFHRWIDGSETPVGAEPFELLRRRARGAFNRAMETPGPVLPGPVLIVAHGGLFRAIRAEMGLRIDVRTPNATPIWCEPSEDGWTLTPHA
jgi:broad specificity phosphatase PhoE